MDETLVQKLSVFTVANSPQKLEVCKETNKHSHTEVITDLCIKLPGKGERYLLEVKINSGAEICVLPLRAHRRMFPNNIPADRLPKLMPSSQWPTSYYSPTFGIIPVFGTVILKVAQYRTDKFTSTVFL